MQSSSSLAKCRATSAKATCVRFSRSTARFSRYRSYAIGRLDSRKVSNALLTPRHRETSFPHAQSRRIVTSPTPSSILFAGCAFLTYSSRQSALKAQKELHDKKTLQGVSANRSAIGVIERFSSSFPQMGHPLQVKPADTQKKGKNRTFRATIYLFEYLFVEEAKLFVGMIPKATSFTEEDLMKTFRPFGIVVSCTILRTPDGTSKGIAKKKKQRGGGGTFLIN